MATDGRALGERPREREEQLRTAQEMAEFGIWEWDIASGDVEWSDQLHVIYGTTPESHPPSFEGYLAKVHPADRGRIAAAISQAHTGHEPFEFDERIVCPDGAIRTLHSRGRVVLDDDGEAIRVIGVCRDVTDQRNAETALREHAERLAEAQSIAHIGSWEWDVVRDVVRWSDELYRIYGLDPDSSDASYTGFLDHVHPDDRNRVDQAVEHAFMSASTFEFEYRAIRADGGERTVRATGRAVADDTGRAIRMVGTAHDITEQVRAQKRVAASSAAIALAERLGDLQLITETALAHLSLEDLLPELLRRICQALHFQQAAVLLMDSDGETLAVRAARGRDLPRVGTRLARGDEVGSAVAIPLRIGDEILGALHIGTASMPPLSVDELSLIELAAERAALAIEHARIYERERSTAETLQRALLPAKLPELHGMTAAVRYVPASEDVDIGGDWYDVIRLPGDRVGVALGDVTGHGIEAATLMGQLRHGLRAYALDNLDPGPIADRLDRLIHSPEFERLATLFYAVIDPDLTMRYVNAGHLPPLIVSQAGSARFLTGSSGVPIGVAPETLYKTELDELEPGDILVVYTDGLIERRGESIDEGMDRLRTTALAGPPTSHGLADHLLRTLLPGAGGEDDIALLTLRAETVPSHSA